MNDESKTTSAVYCAALLSEQAACIPESLIKSCLGNVLAPPLSHIVLKAVSTPLPAKFSPFPSFRVTAALLVAIAPQIDTLQPEL